MTDPIADMLTRIRNAVHSKQTRVDMPASKLKAEIARILQDEGYIHGFKMVEEPVVRGEEAEAVAHLVPGCRPAPDWSRRVLDAHAEGFACVGGALEPTGSLLARRKAAAQLEAWAPEGGRKPGFDHPLLCPSLLVGLVPDWSEVAGLPALADPPDPWTFDARIRVRVPA